MGLAHRSGIRATILDPQGSPGAKFGHDGRTETIEKSGLPGETVQRPVGPVALNGHDLPGGVDLPIAGPGDLKMPSEHLGGGHLDRLRIRYSTQPIPELDLKGKPPLIEDLFG